MARLAHIADDGSLDEYLTLFVPDAVWIMAPNPTLGLRGSERRGHAAILADRVARRGEGFQGPGSHSRHVTSTVTVQVTSSESATAESSWMLWRDTDTAPTLAATGRYADTFRKTSKGWKLAVRRVTLG